MKQKFVMNYKGFNIYDDGRKIVFFYKNYRFSADSIEEAQSIIDDEFPEEGVDRDSVRNRFCSCS